MNQGTRLYDDPDEVSSYENLLQAHAAHVFEQPRMPLACPKNLHGHCTDWHPGSKQIQTGDENRQRPTRLNELQRGSDHQILLHGTAPLKRTTAQPRHGIPLGPTTC